MEQFQGNLLGETEARTDCGRQPIGDSDREDMHLNRVTKPTSKMDAAAKAQQAASKATTTSKSRPTNQTGTKAKPKISKNRMEKFEENYRDQASYHFRIASSDFLDGMTLRPGEDMDMGGSWEKTSNPKYVKALGTVAGYQSSRLIHRLRSAETAILIESRTYLTPLVELGFDTAVGPGDPVKSYVSRDEMDYFFKVWVRNTLKDTLKSSVGVMRLWGLGRPPERLAMQSNLEVHEMDLVDCAVRQAKLAYAYGFVTGAKSVGKTVILVAHADGAQCPRSGSKLVSVEKNLGRLVCIRRGCRMKYSVADQ